MPTLEKTRQLARNTDYVVHSISLTDEMFFTADLSVKAEVHIDEYPVGNSFDGIYHTGLFRLSGYCSKDQLSYKRTSWTKENGEPLATYSQLAAVLDLELRACLMNRFNAELYDLTTLELPYAQTVAPWRKRFAAWLRSKR